MHDDGSWCLAEMMGCGWTATSTYVLVQPHRVRNVVTLLSLLYSASVVRLRPALVCLLYADCSSETESRSTGGDGARSIGSDEENNWGMDESIDVNAVRT